MDALRTSLCFGSRIQRLLPTITFSGSTSTTTIDRVSKLFKCNPNTCVDRWICSSLRIHVYINNICIHTYLTNIQTNICFPARGSLLITWGLVLGLILCLTGIILLIAETYKRIKFQRRVYVD